MPQNFEILLFAAYYETIVKKQNLRSIMKLINATARLLRHRRRSLDTSSIAVSIRLKLCWRLFLYGL